MGQSSSLHTAFGLTLGMVCVTFTATSSKIIVTFKAGTPAEVVEAAAQKVIASGGSIGHRYTTTMLGFSASVPDSLLPSFSGDESVEGIEADGEVSALFASHKK